MRTWIIEDKEKKIVEVLDDMLLEEGTKIFLPEWGGKHLVNEVIFFADMQSGKCSLTQQVMVCKYEEEKQ